MQWKKKNIVGEIKQEVKESINTIVDDRNKELEDRKRGEMNVVIFNLKEHTNESGHINKQEEMTL